MKTVTHEVAEHPFLKSFSSEYRAIVLQGAEERAYAPGEVIFRQSEPANQLFLILDGRVTLECRRPNGKKTVVQTLQRGDSVGWSWLFPPFNWHFDAIAAGPTRLLVLEGARLLVACEEDPDFGFNLIKRIAQVVINRLQATRQTLLASRTAAFLPSHSEVGRVWTPGAWDRDKVEEMITAHPFTRGLSADSLKELAGCAMAVDFKEGESIFVEGDVANRFYLLHSGHVALEAIPLEGPAIPVQSIGAGDVLGWSWLFPPYYWHFNARVVQPTHAIFFYGTRLREACEENHRFGYELMKRMTQVVIHRLQSTQAQLAAVEDSKPCVC